MPPKTKFTRDEIVKAAMDVVDRNGLSALTARSVAIKLGSSTAPVYSQFATMEELALEVIKEILRLLLDYTRRPYTDRLFLNMGTGVAMFACEHKHLYRALLLESDNYADVVSQFIDSLSAELPKDPRFATLSENERKVLLRKMWTFTHGLSSLICVGLIKNCNREFIIDTLLDVGADVIGATLARHEQAKGKN